MTHSFPPRLSSDRMEYDRLSFVEAVEELAKRAGVEVPREGGDEPRVVMDGPLDALAAAQRYFIERLRHAPSAIEYLKKRSEEHTSELQSLMRISYAVFCLKKKRPPVTNTPHISHIIHQQQ